ncbi:MAG: glutathione S-transferase family protein [Legionella sp.]|uniref:glutathione S-transferase C-terminal domain-containing protein n=1 Tax=Legionella sp. TaxID=459 RepID=UPI0039E4BF47
MITLYSYPQLFGLPDNNPFGLKVDTFLRFTQLQYRVEHILNTKDAPRGQLPYIIDEGELVTDSNLIINYLIRKYKLTLDKKLAVGQKNLHFLITRMLDCHLYWIMSYSRWQDEEFWPLFKAEFLKQLPQLNEGALENSRKYNLEKYHYQGISRYDKEQIYQTGIEDLRLLSELLGANDFFFGKVVHTVDACCYGFLANIFFFDIDTPLKKFLVEETQLAGYVQRVRGVLGY